MIACLDCKRRHCRRATNIGSHIGSFTLQSRLQVFLGMALTQSNVALQSLQGSCGGHTQTDLARSSCSGGKGICKRCSLAGSLDCGP